MGLDSFGFITFEIPLFKAIQMRRLLFIFNKCINMIFKANPMKSVKRLFPTLIYTAAYPVKGAARFTSQLARETELFRESDSEGQRWSRKNYLSGYTSYSSITDLAFRSSQFENLKAWIDGEVQKFAETLEMDLGSGRLQMTSFWINIMEEHCTHASHLHPLSSISGTFYLQVPKGAPGIKFEDPRLAQFMASPPRHAKARTENRRFIEVKPKAGTLILFESWLKHEVPPNRSHEERISVSFNYDWIQ